MLRLFDDVAVYNEEVINPNQVGMLVNEACRHALNNRGVRYILLGMGAALLEGAPVATQDLDVWFERIDDERIKLAAKDAGGFWISGFGAQPPAFGGAGLDRIDVILEATLLARRGKQ